MRHYEDRYVAFIDILGFSELVKRTESEPEFIEKLATILEALKASEELSKKREQGNAKDHGLRISSFSDCILLSANSNNIGSCVLAVTCIHLCLQLLSHGIFTRGAISPGKLIHTNQVALGQGLIDAYRLENKVAVYPRIILDKKIVAELFSKSSMQSSPSFVRRDSDGLYHLHIFQSPLSTMVLNGSPENNMTLGRREIEKAVNDLDMSIKAKAGWLARYFNEYAADMGLPKITVG